MSDGTSGSGIRGKHQGGNDAQRLSNAAIELVSNRIERLIETPKIWNLCLFGIKYFVFQKDTFAIDGDERIAT
ncbi:MAG: hypothetical protein Q7K57_42485 [Burkholderiaceae bacterium]|nr:hypothetical protein [Burkholderiaceae bacterium]